MKSQRSTAESFSVPIGGEMYAIRFDIGPIIDVQGEAVYAGINHGQREILIWTGTPLANILEVTAAAVATAWREAVMAFGQKLQSLSRHFVADAEGLELLEGELSEDDAGGVFATFDRMVASGFRFHPEFIANMGEFRRSCVATDTTDDDLSVDDGFENEDPNEDGANQEIEDDCHTGESVDEVCEHGVEYLSEDGFHGMQPSGKQVWIVQQGTDADPDFDMADAALDDVDEDGHGESLEDDGSVNRPSQSSVSPVRNRTFQGRRRKWDRL